MDTPSVEIWISHVRPNRQKNSIQCGYCGKFGHYEAKCRKKKSESAFTSRQLTNYTSSSNHNHNDCSGMFVMKHIANSMTTSNLTRNSNSKDVWFVESGASNHMISHEDWFGDL